MLIQLKKYNIRMTIQLKKYNIRMTIELQKVQSTYDNTTEKSTIHV